MNTNNHPRWIWIILGSILFALLLIFLSACGEEAPSTGRVMGKIYNPAHDEHYTTFVCVSYDSKGGCSVQMPVDNVNHISDHWYLTLENCKTDKDGDEKCRTGDHPVNQYDYDRHEVGDYYPKADEHVGSAK